MDIKVRDADPSDKAELLMMRRRLWPNTHQDHQAELDHFFGAKHAEREIFMAEMGDGDVVGFAECSIRAHAEGCTSNAILHLTGLYVKPIARARGVEASLNEAISAWGKARKCKEYAADLPLDDSERIGQLDELGFEEVGALRCFRKKLL